jgi:hypothetical protein
MATNNATKTVTNNVNNRLVIDFAYEKEMAEKRNARAAYAEFEAGYEDKRVIVWVIGSVTIEEHNGKKVYAGRLSTSTMYLGKKAGYSSRGAIKPVPFVYEPETKKVFASSGETQERRIFLATHVARLMEKYLAGQARINGAKDIETVKKVKGYNMLRMETFKTFLKAYRGITGANTDMSEVADTIVASLPDLD